MQNILQYHRYVFCIIQHDSASAFSLVARTFCLLVHHIACVIGLVCSIKKTVIMYSSSCDFIFLIPMNHLTMKHLQTLLTKITVSNLGHTYSTILWPHSYFMKYGQNQWHLGQHISICITKQPLICLLLLRQGSSKTVHLSAIPFCPRGITSWLQYQTWPSITDDTIYQPDDVRCRKNIFYFVHMIA